MAINTFWDDGKKTRVLVEFETSWSWDELENAIRQIDQFIASVQHNVDIIIDVEGSTLPNDFMKAAKGLLNSNDDARDNEGHRIIVGASDTIRKAYQTFANTFGKRLIGREVLFANDLSHARAMLHSMRLD